MGFFVIAYLAGVLTIATPCVFPILPFVLARAGEPFRRGGLPLLLGLAVSFAVTASLAAVAGGWAVRANTIGRTAALAAMALFGLTMLLPALAVRVTAPIVAIGSGLANWADRRSVATGASSLLLGVATGLLWAPCAGPVLGLILTGAALRSPGVETSLLLLTYGLGAATALAGGMLAGGRVLAAMRRSIRWGERVRPLLGAAVIAGAASIWLGLDTGALARWSSSTTAALEQALLVDPWKEADVIAPSAHAAPAAGLSAPLASLLSARQWLNGAPLRPEDLRGRVVVVNFWTYSCINCLRVLPYVRAWAEKYRGRGLVVVGVHTPEFAFEKDAANVATALDAQGIAYPVAIDSDFGIWRAFGNQAWPALYFIGADGRVRHRVLGEGGYDRSEQLIQRLLSDAGGAPGAEDAAAISGIGAQAEAAARDLRSGETYIGYGQMQSFVSPEAVRRDALAAYTTRAPLAINSWGLAGAWTIGEEFAAASAPGGRIAYRFHARDLHLVLAPSGAGDAIRFRVTLDGAPPGADHGWDVDAEGWGSVRDGRLYQLIRQGGPVMDRTFEIEFFGAGVRAYAFTFG